MEHLKDDKHGGGELLRIEGLSYIYPGSERPALRSVTLSLNVGECVCITGPSGCGKTTLLLAAAGLLEGMSAAGSIQLSQGEESGPAAGLVFQNAESQILCPTVEDEVAFGPENLGIGSEEIWSRVRNALNAVGLAGFEKRNVEALSAGEKHRLSIASVLSAALPLLILDEPTGQLDAHGKADLLEIIKRLKGSGHSLLIADHDFARFRPVADRFVFMEEGAIIKVLKELPEKQEGPPSQKEDREAKGDPSGFFAIEIGNLHLTGPQRIPVFRGAELKVRRRELVHLFGCNGAGKSSLLSCMAGILRPEAGKVRMAGVCNPRPEELLGEVGFLFQNPERQLFEETVFREVAFSLERLRYSAETIREQVHEALALCEISHLIERSPLTLSYGEQHRVALASVIAPKPKILLLDEPFAGLDFMQRLRILSILAKLRRDTGTTVLIASHDPLPDDRWADRVVILEGGLLEESKG